VGHRAQKKGPFAWLGVCAFLLASGTARAADGQCCSGYIQQCAGAKARWCVASGAPADALPSSFCDYGEKVVSTLEVLFNLPEKGQFEFDVEFPTSGGAHTGTACGTYGSTVTGDAFTNLGYDVAGFWGYTLSLHEAINVWTGSVSSGWPNDYWADHVSGFPLSTDWHVMATIGAASSDANLEAASAALHSRYEDGDGRIGMFDAIFARMGYAGYGRAFAYVRRDGIDWDRLGVANPDRKRSEYVVAYISLGAGQSVLPIMQEANVCNDMPDTNTGPACSQPGCPGVAQLAAYPCDEANIDAIANAHCAIAANGMPPYDVAALEGGNYAAVSPGPCGSTCPGECGCDTATMRCVAPWLADTVESPARSGSSQGCSCAALGGNAGSPLWLAGAGLLSAAVTRLRPRRAMARPSAHDGRREPRLGPLLAEDRHHVE